MAPRTSSAHAFIVCSYLSVVHLALDYLSASSQRRRFHLMVLLLEYDIHSIR